VPHAGGDVHASSNIWLPRHPLKIVILLRPCAQ
jgi:hypothetical protein